MQFYYLKMKTKLKCKSCACKYVLDCKKQEKERNVKKFTYKKVETWKRMKNTLLSKLHEKFVQKIMMQIQKSHWINWDVYLKSKPRWIYLRLKKISIIGNFHEL